MTWIQIAWNSNLKKIMKYNVLDRTSYKWGWHGIYYRNIRVFKCKAITASKKNWLSFIFNVFAILPFRIAGLLDHIEGLNHLYLHKFKTRFSSSTDGINITFTSSFSWRAVSSSFFSSVCNIWYLETISGTIKVGVEQNCSHFLFDTLYFLEIFSKEIKGRL